MKRQLAGILAAALLVFLIPHPATAAPLPMSLSAPAVVSAPTAAAPAKPPVLYQSTKVQPLYASASKTSKKLKSVKKASYLSFKQLKGSWVRVSYSGVLGWLPLASAKKLAQTRYEAKVKLGLRTSPGSGKTVITLAKGKTAYATGRTSGKYLQLYVPGKTGWTAKTSVQRPIVAKYQTKRATTLYAGKTSTKKLATVPADYTLATRTNAKSVTRVHVSYGSKTGWVTLKQVSKVALATKVGKLSWVGSAKKNIAKWCKGVPITAGRNLGNYAQASGWSGHMKESITLGTADFFGGTLDPNHPMAIATQYHECAHLLQYRAYDYDFTRMGKAMDKVYGKPRTASGTEHMADCMAEAMGAKRTGFDAAGGYTWTAGYGGKCTSTHLKKAKLIIAGKRV